MNRVAWSAVIGSVPVIALYWTGRLRHSSGPPSGFWIDFTMLFLMPGYYFLAAIDGLLHFSQSSQKTAITLMIAFDCVFWSLVVMLLWIVLRRLFDKTADQRVKL